MNVTTPKPKAPTPKPGVMPQPPKEVWDFHLKSCGLCRNNPYDFCPIGKELIKKAVEA